MPAGLPVTTTSDLTPILEDLELEGEAPGRLGLASPDASNIEAIVAACDSGSALVELPGQPEYRELATLRDALWPRGHIVAIYRLDADGRVARVTVGGKQVLEARLPGEARTVLYVRDRRHALGQSTTRAKFDANAEGWNGVPGSPTYGHYRWMRKLLADVAKPARGQRVLDAGCGAGWVGIEAALKGAMASAFDPSPAMVEIAKRNAAENGVDMDARVGFVEDVPFDQPFELVLDSGVISFAPDPDVFLDRLDALLEPGGLLVIGDLNPTSRGFARRRRRPLLPARELNGLSRPRLEQMLEARGYTLEGRWYYQLTFPLPELMALSEQRMGGLGCSLALAVNKLATAIDHGLGSKAARWFDSWIVRARKPGA